MPEKQTFTFYLTVEIDAMNDDSALTKLENWVEPTLALKKNADINLSAVEVDESEVEAEPEPEVEKPSVVKSAMKATKKRPELKIPEKDDFDYDNIPDWDELEEEEKPKPSKRKAAPKVEEEDDLDALLAGLEDDEDENHEDTENGDEPEDDDDEDDDWWDDDEW